MAFLWKAMGFGEAVPGFPFTAQAEAKATVLESCLVPWTLKQGKSDEDGKPVTIFSVALSHCNTDEKKTFARNALAVSKRLRLPGVLRCYGGVEHNDTVYLAMEPCESLPLVLADPARRMEYYGGGGASGPAATIASSSSSPPSTSSPPTTTHTQTAKQLFEEGVAMGLKSIGHALTALHQNDLYHGNVCADSVFVIESGFWRLWGFELTSQCAAGATFASVAPHYLPPCRAPRQLLDQLSGSGNPRMADSFGLGCLVYEALVLTLPSTPHDLASRRNLQLQDVRQGRAQLPQSLQQSFHKLTETNPKAQCTVAQFMANCSFINDSDYVQSIEELEELALWDQGKRDNYMERLAKEIPSFPRKACVTVFLSKLMESVRMGTASASVVAPVMTIAQRVPKEEGEEEFNATITPALVVLYASTDRVTRYRLLQHMDVYGSRIAAKPLNDQIWPMFMKGFSNPAANIREYTARALVPIAPKLSAHAMTNDVPRLLQTLQQDPDGTIRANATICFCLIADYIPNNNNQRAKILVVAFGRMLKDSFHPSKMAALNSFNATLHHVPAKLMADMVVPGVAPITMDADAEVRQSALSILQKCMAKLEEHHRKAKAAAPTTAGGAANSTAPSTAPSASPASPASPASLLSQGLGFGLWGSDPPSTSSLQKPSPPVPSPKHGDPMHLSGTDRAAVAQSGSSSSAKAAPVAVARTAATATTTAPPTTSGGWSDDEDEDDDWGTAPAVKPVVPATAPRPQLAPTLPTPAHTSAKPKTATGSGWSDDDDGDGGWGTAPTTAPVTHPAAAGASRSGEATTTASTARPQLRTATAAMSLSGGAADGPPKPQARRKAGGLGASRMD